MRQIYLYNFKTKQEFEESVSVIEPYAAYVAEEDKVYYPHTSAYSIEYDGVETLEFIGDTEFGNNTLNVDGFSSTYSDGNLTFN